MANFAVIGLLSVCGRALSSLQTDARAPSDSESAGDRTNRLGSGSQVRRILFWFGLFVVALGMLGAVVVVSGIMPIKASSGHWAITAWFLNFSMSRSVSTHSLGIDPPKLDDPTRVVKGGAHYESGCSPCHGSPELPHPTIALHMTPHPPYLPKVLAQWEPEELFYIVKHGVKFTGMPAWPTQQRDDEVWAMVAFLLRLPELNVEEYRELAYGETAEADGQPTAAWAKINPTDAITIVREHCARCHGVDGLGRGAGAFPRLAGQRREYIYNALQAFARGERHSGIMEPIAAGLSSRAMLHVSEYYSGLEPPNESEPQLEVSKAAIERGAEIVRNGIPAQRVPACSDCHGPNPIRRNPNYPRLSGQYPEYLLLQLQLLKQRDRGGSDYVDLMYPVASRLSEEQMRDVAVYYGVQPPERTAGSADDLRR